ncbi:MAG: PTS system mannose/fructose/sorbose family transporter subunit IID [Archangium sp.]|nr:PTS system mannose/fructose/sorbose family transporter subunit IID [Archangium sp.]
MIPFLTLLRIAWRSLFIQAGFSPEAMQSLGLLYVLEPAWPRLYPDENARREAVKRHLSPFNTHPYAAAALVGGILFHEVKVARGEGTVEDVVRFKQTLMGPLAALGDGFYWLSLRPAAGALSAVLVPVIGPWSALVFLALYNVVHLATRAWLFATGYREGAGVVARLATLRVPMWSTRLRSIAAACAAGIGVWFASWFGTLGGAGLAPGFVCLALGVLGVVALERKFPPLLLLYASAAVATLAGALL